MTQSQPSRASASDALYHLGPVLFASNQDVNQTLQSSTRLVKFHRSLLALLQDDDDEIRVTTADLVRKALGSPTEVCQARALEMWWAWCEAHIRRLDAEAQLPWLEWMKELSQEAKGFGECTSFILQ